ncbi:MAG: EFR1 family ferrodoxin [Pseudomonadota bacterium]
MNLELLKLVYFSPTGTTKKIVEAIAQGIDIKAMKLFDITKLGSSKQQLQTSENELLIIGMPVYFGRAQANAIEWLTTVKAHNTPTICVVVYGNREYEDALLELKDTAIKAGCLPIACGAFIGEHSFSTNETPIAAGRPDTEDINYANSFGQKIMEKILSVPSIDHIAGVTVPGKYPYKNIEDSVKMFSFIDFIAVNDSCLQCGLCSQNCPVDAIDPENSKSINIRKCILCNACIKVCPENARYIDNDTIKNIAQHLNQKCQTRKEPIIFM